MVYRFNTIPFKMKMMLLFFLIEKSILRLIQTLNSESNLGKEEQMWSYSFWFQNYFKIVIRIVLCWHQDRPLESLEDTRAP